MNMKKIIFFLVFVLIVNNLFISDCLAEKSQIGSFVGATRIDDSQNVGSIAAVVISALLSILSLIFIILLLYAGFIWMTARGEEQQVNKAKDTIQMAVIGLVVIMAAYSITYFVFKALPFKGSTTEGGVITETSGQTTIWDINSWWGMSTIGDGG